MDYKKIILGIVIIVILIFLYYWILMMLVKNSFHQDALSADVSNEK